MSKTKKIRVDYDDTTEMLELILILKDIATNLFHRSARRKQVLIDFVGYFIDFLKLASFLGGDHPLVNPTSKATGIIAITSESGFMGDVNSRMITTLKTEVEKSDAKEIIVVGSKTGDKVKALYGGKAQNVQVVSNISQRGIYKSSVEAKDAIVKLVIEGKIGRVVAVYPFAINLNVIKSKTAILFPSTEVFEEAKQENIQENIQEVFEPMLVESDKKEIIGYLASVWLTCRIYELLMNAGCSSFAAQAQQLDSAADRLKKDKMFLGMALRKSRKADISKSLSEVFASRMMSVVKSGY